MKTTFISREKNQVNFTMEFTAEELEEAIIKAYQEEKGQFEIDGFRKGKAPRSIIEKKYGENVFTEGAINSLFNTSYPQAIKELNLEVIDAPKVEFSKYEKGTPFSGTISVEVMPKFDVKDYKGVEIEKIEGNATEEDLNNELENLRKKNARMVTVEGAAKDGDTVLIDYKGFVGDEQFEGGTAENFPLKLGSNSFIPGFEEQLIGATKDGDVDVKCTFPEEYHAEALAGKEAIFKCHIHEIKAEELPELDDEFAKDVSEFDTVEELKKDTMEKIQKSKEAQVLNKMKDNALGKVYEANDLDIPNAMVETEIDNMMQEFEQQLMTQGMNLQQYFQYLGKEPVEFRGELKEDAFKRVKTRMLVGAIAEQEGMEATKEEIDKEVELMAAQYSLEVEKIREMLGEENLGFLGSDIKMRKAVDFIYDNAVIK